MHIIKNNSTRADTIRASTPHVQTHRIKTSQTGLHTNQDQRQQTTGQESYKPGHQIQDQPGDQIPLPQEATHQPKAIQHTFGMCTTL
jgi:hypothetical protein